MLYSFEISLAEKENLTVYEACVLISRYILAVTGVYIPADQIPTDSKIKFEYMATTATSFFILFRDQFTS